MEQYVYFSIIFFSLIVLLLYLYIIIEKFFEVYKNKKINKYSNEIIPYIDYNIIKIKRGENIDYNMPKTLKNICKNKYKRIIVEQRLIYYLENFKGKFSDKITELCIYIGLVQYEISNLKDKNSFKKALACKKLGQFRSKEALAALLKEVNTINIDVKYNALLAIAKIGDEKSFIKAFEKVDFTIPLSERSLIEIVDNFEGDKSEIYNYMVDSKNDFISCIFIKSAANYKNIILSNKISKYLTSKSKEKRIASIKALSNAEDERYLDNIIKLLEDNEWEVRAVAAKALGNFKNPRILIPLIKCLSDSEWYVRYNAAISILNNEEGLNVLYLVFEGEDNFAKDIVISAIENSHYSKELYSHKNLKDIRKQKLLFYIKNYIKIKNEKEKT